MSSRSHMSDHRKCGSQFLPESEEDVFNKDNVSSYVLFQSVGIRSEKRPTYFVRETPFQKISCSTFGYPLLNFMHQALAR